MSAASNSPMLARSWGRPSFTKTCPQRSRAINHPPQRPDRPVVRRQLRASSHARATRRSETRAPLQIAECLLRAA
eukprot:6199389-Pleurochrysis_carterae.AAC.4